MKIRSDFVTNSSSSSFVLAKKSEFTEKQKKAILEYVENRMFGEKIAGTKEELEKFFEDNYGANFKERPYYFEQYKKALKALERGLCVYSGIVSFEFEYEYAEALKELWNKLKEADDEFFVDINTDLDF